jgi:hypothetical protein
MVPAKTIGMDLPEHILTAFDVLTDNAYQAMERIESAPHDAETIFVLFGSYLTRLFVMDS